MPALLSRAATAAALSCLFSILVFAQSADGPKPDRWRGLVIDESTPEDALKTLGDPESDKVDRLPPFLGDSKWISKKHKEKIFRKIAFKKVEGFDKAELAFLDNKLVMIYLDFSKQIEAAALSRIYGLQFTPKVGGLNEGWSPGDYERNQGKVYPKTYPSSYYLVAVTSNTMLGSFVSNSSFAKILRESVGATDTGDFPGKVSFLQIISRKLENRDGSDVLK